jgi:hypothetical protein
MQPQKSLYNPLKEDFTVQWAGDGNPQDYTIHAGEIGTYSIPLANHIEKHLADFIYGKRGQKTNHDDDIAEIIKEIGVTI